MSPQEPLDLHYQVCDASQSGGTPLVLLHGLFGSSSNWLTLMRRCCTGRRVLVPDLRNHGRSPHHAVMDYPAMAADVLRLADRLGWGRFLLVGHSMGAKVAMYLALSSPDRVERLVCLDMAPAPYPPRFCHVFEAMQNLPLERLTSRRQADGHLAVDLEDPRLRAFLLQNLEQRDGRWRWRVNLDALQGHAERLRSFPELPPDRRYLGPALFLYGDRSDYVQPHHWPMIQARFPFAKARPIAGAGHWVHADRPEEVVAALAGFLRSD